MNVSTEYSHLSTRELLRIAMAQKVLTSLEVEMIKRIDDLMDHVDELKEVVDNGQRELPLQ